MTSREQKLVNAAKVMLLEARNRSYLMRHDPHGMNQLIEAVYEFDPTIREQIIAAEKNRRFVDSNNCPKCVDSRNNTVDPFCPYHGY